MHRGEEIDEFDDVLKLDSGELGHHLIDATLMTAAITVSDTLSAADQRIRWMKNDSEAIRHGTGIYILAAEWLHGLA